MNMKRLLNLDKVLCLSPHPDDVEYSMGGTIASHQSTKFDIITLSQGGDFDLANDVRTDEFKAYWALYDNAIVSEKHLGGHIKDFNEDAIVNFIENAVDVSQYDAIFTPPSLDFHFEHRLVNSASKAVTRTCKVSLIEYMTPSIDHTWTPNIYVEIDDDTFKEKRNHLQQTFKTQATRKYFSDQCINDFHSDFFSSKRKNGWVEKYKISFLFN